MKILFVTRGFPSDGDPMDGNYEAVQAKAIAAKGHEVSVIGIHYRNVTQIFKMGKVRHRVVDGVHVYECTRMHLYNPIINSFWVKRKVLQFQFRQVFKKYLKEMGMPDIVHAHIVLWALPAICVKTEYHLPLVITEHWSKMFEDVIPKRILEKTFAYQYADSIISVSDVLAEHLRQYCNVHSVVIRNMVANHFFDKSKEKSNSDGFKFIAVGNLLEIKRYDLLIEAFASCNFPEDVVLNIVGEGSDRQLFEKKIKDCQVERQVKLLGVKTPEEVSNLLCHSDCFTLSSRLETFSIALIEAMAKGLPVIATKCGGPETFVRPKDGLLVENENVEEFAKAMKYMRDHSQEYDSDEIRRHCRDNFSQDVIADKIIEIYKQILKK